MRGEALESLGQKEEALCEYEVALEKDPRVGVKQRIASLRKERAKP
jgi:predicted negative regulator of RcsB-dependent stress response